MLEIKTEQIPYKKMKKTSVKKDLKLKKQEKNCFCIFIKKKLQLIIFSLFILILILIILKLYHFSSYKLINKFQENLEQKELNEFSIDGHHEVPVKILRYIKQCRDGFLLHKENLILSTYPKISVIIPVYNRKKYILYSVRSCQNQKMKDIEIIIIDDLSDDGSVELIKNLQKEDPRIRLITNNKRKGTLYNRYTGTVQAKGKYIIHLDSDDLFVRNDLFDRIYNEAEQGNYDIVAFDGFHSKNFNMSAKSLVKFHYTHDKNITVIQPKLSDLLYKYKGKIKISPNDLVIWGKLVKKEVMIKSYELLGSKTYNKFWTVSEDTVTSYALFKIAKSYRIIKFIGIYILWGKKKHVKNAAFKKYKPYKYLNRIQTLLDLIKIYPNDKDILLKELFIFQKDFKKCKNKKLKEESIRILNGILELKNIKQNDRDKINNIINICMKKNN